MGVVIGACLAGLFLLLRDLIPWLQAQRTGRIRKRGHGRQVILRAEEPERFRNLMRNHTDGMVIGLLAIGFGIAWQFFWLLALILIIPIGAVMTAQARRNKRQQAANAPAEAYEGPL